MNMEELYEKMKEALCYFGLRFSEMDKVGVYLSSEGLDRFIVFTYNKSELKNLIE